MTIKILDNGCEIYCLDEAAHRLPYHGGKKYRSRVYRPGQNQLYPLQPKKKRKRKKHGNKRKQVVGITLTVPNENFPNIPVTPRRQDAALD